MMAGKEKRVHTQNPLYGQNEKRNNKNETNIFSICFLSANTDGLLLNRRFSYLFKDEKPVALASLTYTCNFADRTWYTLAVFLSSF